MPSHYPDTEELTRVYRGKSTEWLREQLASGTLTWSATSVAMEELARRGEAPPAPHDHGGSGGGIHGGDADDSGPNSEEEQSASQTRRAWPWWSWLIVFALSFAVIASQGTHAHGPENQGFLWGVIVVQSVVLSLGIAVVASMIRAKSAIGAVGRIIVLVLLGLLQVGLWVLSLLAREGWGG